MPGDERPDELSNIRELLGWAIGCRVVDVTAGDPPAIPDADDVDADTVVLHFDNGGTLAMPIGDDGFTFFDPDRPGDD